MQKYMVTYGINLIPDPGNYEKHPEHAGHPANSDEGETLYQLAPQELEAENFGNACFKVDQMIRLDDEITFDTPMCAYEPLSAEFPDEKESVGALRRHDPDNEAEPPTFLWSRISAMDGTPDLDPAGKFWEDFAERTQLIPNDRMGYRIQPVPIDYIYLDPAINTRPIWPGLVEEYEEAMLAYAEESDNPDHWQKEWREFPKVVSTGYCFGGFHTLTAAKKAFGSIEVRVQVYHGTRKDAFLMATGENYSHGKRRTREELRASVRRWLEDEDGKTWANRHIAEKCHTSRTTVARIEESLAQDDSYTRPTRRRMLRDGQEVWIETEKIGDQTEEPLPIIEQSNELTEMMSNIEDHHAALAQWYSEGSDLESHDRHMACVDLRLEYMNLKTEWIKHEERPINNLEKHLDGLVSIREKAHEAEQLQEAATNILYHRDLIREWYNEGHKAKMSALALYCTEYAKGIEEELEICYNLVAEQHQLPVELLTWHGSHFLRQPDIEELNEARELLAETVQTLRSTGLEVPTKPPKTDAGGEDDTPETTDTQPTRTKPREHDSGLLDDDETELTPVEIAFAKLHSDWGELFRTGKTVGRHFQPGDAGKPEPRRTLWNEAKEHREALQSYALNLEELIRQADLEAQMEEQASE